MNADISALLHQSRLKKHVCPTLAEVDCNLIAFALAASTTGGAIASFARRPLAALACQSDCGRAIPITIRCSARRQ
jgi:hypothetical protein